MSDAAVIRKADVDILVAVCATFLPDDVSPEVTAAFDRLLTAWDEVGGWTDHAPPRPSAEWLCERCKAIHPWHEGDRFTVPCPDCETPMTPTSPLLRDLQAARAENAELRAKVARSESGITWGTSCLPCSAVLDSCIAETFRREGAEGKLAEAVLMLGEIRETVTNFLGQYGASKIPMFKVGQDLANSVLTILNGGVRDDGLNNGRPALWSDACPPGEMVCAVPDPARPDGICGSPVESEPCGNHKEAPLS